MFERLRIYFRRKMPYMEAGEARVIKEKLALIYAVLGWNILGGTVYYIFKENVPRTPLDSVDYAKLLGVHDATVVKMSGLKKVSEYDIHLEEEELEKFYTKPETVKAEEPIQKENIEVVK